MPIYLERKMKRIAVMMAAVVAASVHAAVPASLERSLAGFERQELTYKDGVLRMVMNRSVVQWDVFSTVTTLGLCAPYWRKEKDLVKFSPRRFEVVNARQAQGFALAEDIAKGCAKVGKQGGAEYLKSKTWVCIAGMPCRERRAGEAL